MILSVYIVSIIFSLNNLLYELAKVIISETYGFVDKLYTTITIGIVYSIYVSVLFAEDQIRHFIYYDALTELSNRKKC